jgi:hypothetical protein
MIFEGNGIVYPTYDASDNSLLVTCYNTDTWERIPLAPTGVQPTDNSGTHLRLQSYPNPSRRGATIRFELADYSRTRLDVYDVSGDLVRTLVDELRGPGVYSVMWDRRDGSGSDVTSGTYFLRLEVNDTEQTKAVVLTN